MPKSVEHAVWRRLAKRRGCLSGTASLPTKREKALFRFCSDRVCAAGKRRRERIAANVHTAAEVSRTQKDNAQRSSRIFQNSGKSL